ncbi:MAG: TetR/AcrR family transcriptional regulator, partial [Halanaerobiaceae bacterium]
MNNYKKDIISTAINLFAEHGYHNTSMNMIAEEADVSKGGLYWHFSSKKDLYREIVEIPFNDYINYIKDVEQKEISPEKKLKNIIEYRVNYIKENIKVSKIIMNNIENLDVLKEKICKYKKQNEAILENIFREGIKKGQFKMKDPCISTLVFTSIINTVASNPDILQEKTEEELIEAISEQVFEGIL